MLGWLIARGLGMRNRWRMALAITLAAIYGACDELYQGLVPGRDPDVWDAAADAVGATLGVLTRAATARRSERR